MHSGLHQLYVPTFSGVSKQAEKEKQRKWSAMILDSGDIVGVQDYNRQWTTHAVLIEVLS